MKCSKCNDTGTINEFVLVGNVEYIKTDPTTGRPPLCSCQQEKIFDKYNATSGMKPNEQKRDFSSAVIDEENRHFFMQAQQFVENMEFHLKNGSWLYIFGDPKRAADKGVSAFGTGKSYLTHCIGNELTKRRQKAIYVTEDKLFESIKSTYQKDSSESESDVLFRFQNVPVLLIDDMFKSQYKEWAEDKIFHLLNNRMQPGMVTIINSNYAPNKLIDQMPKHGGAVASRILGQAILMEMIGKDRRRSSRNKAVGGDSFETRKTANTETKD